MMLVRARGIAACSELLDETASRLESEDLEDLVPAVLEIQEDWWASRGRGTWDGHDLEVSGRLRATATQAGADGQRVKVSGDELVFGLDPSAADGPGFYGTVLAGRGWSPIVDPEDADSELLADEYAEIIIDA